MEARASLKMLRVSPRKVRLVCDAVRGKPVNEALALLQFLPQGSAPDLAKLIRSAAANAENNYFMSREDLRVKTIYADEGPTFKRFLPRARGRADRRLTRTSHVTVIVDDGEE
ncbi:MAG: 50S ribosomal protein L22 [Chloroflexi bacterium]|nr:50S ribosomal protein L22 [Chloroflexota bacterium]